MRYAAYYGVADGSEEAVGYDEQVKAARDYASAHNIDIAGEFVSPELMAVDVERAGVNRLLAHIDQLDGVLLYDIQRVSSDAGQTLNLIMALKNKNKLLVLTSTGQQFNFSRSDVLFDFIHAWTDTATRERNRALVKDGIARYKAANGRWGRHEVQIDWQVVEEYRGKGLNIPAIARLVGINRRTLYRRMVARAKAVSK